MKDKWPKKCPRCGCKKQYSKNEDYIANNLCEYDITCSFCHCTYDFYSYGAWEHDRPDKFYWCWHNIKAQIKFIFQSIYYRIKRIIKHEIIKWKN